MSYSGNTALHDATINGDREIIKVLLINGADRHLTNNGGKSPVTLALEKDPSLCSFVRDFQYAGFKCEALFDYPSIYVNDISFKKGDLITNCTEEAPPGWLFGEINARRGLFPESYVKKLVRESRANIQQSIPFGDPEPEDSPLDKRDAYGQTNLHVAAFGNDSKEVTELIAKGCNINAADRNGWTPLHCAASQGHLDIILQLINQPNINLSIVSKDGTPALHYVIRCRPNAGDDHIKIHKILHLFSSQIDVNLPGKNAETALHQAVIRNNEFCALWLINRGADVNAVNQSGDLSLSLSL